MADNTPVIKLIPVNCIIPSRHQARKDFSEESIKSLAASIESEGQLEPVMVRVAPAPNPLPEGAPQDGEWYELIYGERRLRAFKLLGRSVIEAKVVAVTSEAEAAAKGLIENIQREGINPMEEAEGFAHLNQLDQGYWTQGQIAKVAGKTQGYISQSINMLGLPQFIKDNISRLILTRSHALELMRLPSDGIKLKTANEIIAKDLNRESTRLLIDKTLVGKAVNSSHFESKEGCVVDHAPNQNPNKSSIKQTGKRVSAHLNFNAGTDDIALVKNHIIELNKAVKQAQRAAARPAKRAGKKVSSSDVSLFEKVENPKSGMGQGRFEKSQPDTLNPALSKVEAVKASEVDTQGDGPGDSHSFVLPLPPELASKCESELARLEKEYKEANTPEEKAAKKAMLQQARLTYNNLRKEFGTAPIDFPEIS